MKVRLVMQAPATVDTGATRDTNLWWQQEIGLLISPLTCLVDVR